MGDATIHILVADDHPVFRFGLRALLEAQPDMVIVGEASNGQKAVEMALDLKPDLLLLDINMPELNGIEATRQITAADPEASILIITMIDDETVYSAMQAGAKGYLLKGAEGDETLRAIRAVANGEVIFSPGIAGHMLQAFREGKNIADPSPFPDLTSREREVLALLVQGLTNKAIAERLVLSPKTVRNQTSTIFSKLQVVNRSEAIVKARERGFGGKNAK